MRESRYYRGRDIRAVESPYEAAFDLAERLEGLLSSTRAMVVALGVFFVLAALVLINILVLLVVLTTVVFAFDLPSEVEEAGVLLSVFAVFFAIMAPLAVLLAYRLTRSEKFIGELQAQMGLIRRIGSRPAGYSLRYGHPPPPPDYRPSGTDPGTGGGDVVGTPTGGLIDLIRSAAGHSHQLAHTMRMVVVFSVGMMMIEVVMHYLLFGLSDLLSAAGLALALVFFAGVIFLGIRVNERFAFIRERFAAIEYALKLEPQKVPGGKDPAARFMSWLGTCKAYGGQAAVAGAGGEGWFDRVCRTEKGLLLVKALKRPPAGRDIGRLREEAERLRDRNGIDRAVIVYRERDDLDLSEAVYDEVIGTPLRSGDDVCSLQLVAEGSEGHYDFIPVMAY